MVGYVVHIWSTNPQDTNFCPKIDRDLYLVEIGNYYVPVTEAGLHLYIEGMENVYENLGGNHAYDNEHGEENIVKCHHLRGDDGNKNNDGEEQSFKSSIASINLHLPIGGSTQRPLTPILGSSLESPISFLANADQQPLDQELYVNCPMVSTTKAKIKAVSSSSSEDETELLRLEDERQRSLWNMWKQIAEQHEKLEQRLQGWEEKDKSPLKLSLSSSMAIEEPLNSSSASSGEQQTPTNSLNSKESGRTNVRPSLSKSLSNDSPGKSPSKSTGTTREVAVQAVSNSDSEDVVVVMEEATSGHAADVADIDIEPKMVTAAVVEVSGSSKKEGKEGHKSARSSFEFCDDLGASDV